MVEAQTEVATAGLAEGFIESESEVQAKYLSIECSTGLEDIKAQFRIEYHDSN